MQVKRSLRVRNTPEGPSLQLTVAGAVQSGPLPAKSTAKKSPAKAQDRFKAKDYQVSPKTYRCSAGNAH